MWSAWEGALALTAVGLGFYAAFGRPLGVSGSWERCVRGRRGDETAALQTLTDPEQAAFREALRQATLEHFGAAASASADTAAPGAEERSSAAPPPSGRPVPWTVHAVFLGMLAVGGGLAQASTQGLRLSASLGADFERIFSAEPWGLGVLLVGGVWVGFGTRMAGGCTSGHGLSGCGRFQLPSLVATAVFLGTAVAVAWALNGVRP